MRFACLAGQLQSLTTIVEIKYNESKKKNTLKKTDETLINKHIE